jgi:hypothetical protein
MLFLVCLIVVVLRSKVVFLIVWESGEVGLIYR